LIVCSYTHVFLPLAPSKGGISRVSPFGESIPTLREGFRGRKIESFGHSRMLINFCYTVILPCKESFFNSFSKLVLHPPYPLSPPSKGEFTNNEETPPLKGDLGGCKCLIGGIDKF